MQSTGFSGATIVGKSGILELLKNARILARIDTASPIMLGPCDEWRNPALTDGRNPDVHAEIKRVRQLAGTSHACGCQAARRCGRADPPGAPPRLSCGGGRLASPAPPRRIARPMERPPPHPRWRDALSRAASAGRCPIADLPANSREGPPWQSPECAAPAWLRPSAPLPRLRNAPIPADHRNRSHADRREAMMTCDIAPSRAVWQSPRLKFFGGWYNLLIIKRGAKPTKGRRWCAAH